MVVAPTTKESMTNERVMKFINDFTNNGKKEELIDTYTNGYCYWFAHMLADWALFQKERLDFQIYVVYAEIENHFGCLINGRVYDVTGDVTDKYDWKEWTKFYHRDELLGARIVRDCIRKDEV